MISGVLTMTVFSERLIAERVQAFWAVLQRGEFITDAAADAGTYRKKGARWLAAAGGVRAVRAGHRRERQWAETTTTGPRLPRRTPNLLAKGYYRSNPSRAALGSTTIQ
jgi:hypothetical protein